MFLPQAKISLVIIKTENQPTLLFLLKYRQDSTIHPRKNLQNDQEETHIDNITDDQKHSIEIIKNYLNDVNANKIEEKIIIEKTEIKQNGTVNHSNGDYQPKYQKNGNIPHKTEEKAVKSAKSTRPKLERSSSKDSDASSNKFGSSTDSLMMRILQ